MCPVIQGIEAVPGQTLAGEEDSLLSQQDQGDSLLGEPSQSTPNGDLLGGELSVTSIFSLSLSYLQGDSGHTRLGHVKEEPARLCYNGLDGLYDICIS